MGQVAIYSIACSCGRRFELDKRLEQWLTEFEASIIGFARVLYVNPTDAARDEVSFIAARRIMFNAIWS